jgi:rubrerythrin
MEVEEAGARFLNRLADAASDPRMSRIFREMADQEGAHREIFRRMSEESLARRAAESFPEEFFALVMGLVKGITSVTFGDAEVRDYGKNPVRALDLGIATEERVIRMYARIRGALGASREGLLDRVIAEENRHRETFLAVKAKLKL